MTTDLSTKTACVFDCGLMTSVAERLSRDFGRTVFASNLMGDFPTVDMADIGSGLPRIERIKYFWDFVAECDPKADDVLFVFPNVGFGDVQMELVRMGFPVYGSRKAEELELLRVSTKEAMKKLGLAVNPYEVVVGLDALREYIKKHPKTHVKVSEFRGITESFFAENYDLVEARLDCLAVELGPPRKKIQPFICESNIPTKIETGGDTLAVVDGEFGKLSPYGIEIKDCGYLLTAVPVEKLPSCISHLNETLGPILHLYGMRGPYHSEIRCGEDGKDYTIDHTLRPGSPPTEIFEEWISNYSEVIWTCAHGELVEIKPAVKFGFQVALYSDQATDSWLAVQYPEAIRHRVKLYNHHMDANGLSWVVPTPAKLKQIGYVVGLGDTIEEAAKNGLECAEQVKADKLEVRSDMLPKMFDELRAAKKKGIDLGGEIPEKVEV